MKPRRKDGKCSMCGGERDGAGRYCKECHAAYNRAWRLMNPQNEGQRIRSNARAYANVYRKRLLIVPMACEACGGGDAEMHHQDHERPLDVNWLCRPCHELWHNHWRDVSKRSFIIWLSNQNLANDRSKVAA